MPTKLRIEACYFDRGDADTYKRLAAVLERSALANCPDAAVNVVGIGWNPDLPAGCEVADQLEHYADRVAASEDGDLIVLMDADTLVLKPLADVFDRDFDVAYTVRGDKTTRFFFNSGVVFIRSSPSTRAFVSQWREQMRLQLADRGCRDRVRSEFGGFNQAALGVALQGAWPALTLVDLPCVEFNCEDLSWPAFDPDVTRVVHVKGELRRAVLEPNADEPADPAVQKLADLWNAIAQ